MPRLRHLTTAIVASLVFASAAQAKTDIKNMVVFGDSLSDNGNLSLALGGSTASRFTTNPGKVAVEHIGDSLGFNLAPSYTGGNDYAYGGAGIDYNSSPGPIPLLSQQFAMYLAAHGGKADPNTLYSVWGGANDIFYATSGAVSSANIQPLISQSAKDEVKLLSQMHNAGARYVMVFNLPDIGQTPSGIAAGPVNAANLTALSEIYNGIINNGLAKLSDQGLNIIPVNTYQLVHEVVANPQAYGFTNVTDAACGLTSSSLQCGPTGSGATYTYAPGTQNSYLFADGVHPTTAAHRMLAQYVVAEINAPGQISLLGEAPLASSAAHIRTWRTNAMQAMGSTDSRLFANITYGKQTFDATENTSKANSDNVNLTFGTVAHAGDHVTLGGAMGISHDSANMSGNQGGYKLNVLQGSGFIYYHTGAAYIGTYLGFAQLDYKDVQRRFQIGTATRSESGSTTGSQLMGGFLGGWDFHAGKMLTGPFARLQWQKAKINGYAENSGDSSAMWFNSQTRLALQQTLGWRLRGDWTVGELTMHPYAEVSWNRDQHADPRMVRAGLTSMNGSFALTGYIPDRTWGAADLGIMTEFSPTTSGWIGYQGRFADSSQKLNSLNMGLKINF